MQNSINRSTLPKKKKSTDQLFKIVKDNDSVNEDKYALEKHSATFDNGTVDT